MSRCADEITKLPGPIYLYGHCHGAAVTIALANRLQELGSPQSGVAVGAMFPMARMPGRFFDWIYRRFQVDRLVSDRAIQEEVRALGGGLAGLQADPAEQAVVMRAVRQDERCSEEYFTRTLTDRHHPRFSAPMLSIVGSKDRVTELYAERYHEWEHFAEQVDLAVLPRAGHGFLKHQAPELARTLTDWAAELHEPAAMGPSSGAAPQPVPRDTAAGDTAAGDTTARDTTARGGAVDGSRHRSPDPRPGFGRFAVVAAGQLVSAIGSALSLLVMSVWMLDHTGRISAFATTAAVSLLPGILVGPVAGAVADRYGRRTVMLIADATAGATTFGMAMLVALNRPNLLEICLLCGLTSVAAAFQRPAFLAAVAQLVPKPFLGHASGVVQLGAGMGALFAPMIGAGLLTVLPLSVILLIDAATFTVAVGTLAAVRFPDRLFRRREESMRVQLARGVRYVLRRPGLRALMVFFLGDHILYAIGFTLIQPMVLLEHGVGTLGLVLVAGGVGALTGALTMSIWGGTRRRTHGMLLATAASNVAIVVIGLAREPWLIAVGMFGLAFSEALIDGHWMALLQTKEGRVNSLFLVVVTVFLPIGYLVMGPLADHVLRHTLEPGGALHDSVGPVLGTGPDRGLGFVVVISGLLLSVWLLRAWANPRLRLLEDHLPDAVPDAEIWDRDTEQERADRAIRAADGTAAPAAPAVGATVDGPSAEDLAWIETWRAVYDHAHKGTDSPVVGQDFTGWNSSYDGTPIPAEEMREWRDATVERTREYRPRRVLEIGVGSGALLVPLAEHCEHYTGTDLSSVAVDTLDRDLREQRPALHRRVELRAQLGHVADGLRASGYDLIILNSVVQYFPSRDYLSEVLDVALGLLTPGGHIFVGDVRNLRLHGHLRAAVRQHAPSPAAVAGAGDTELLVDPALWDDLARGRPQIVGVDLRVKRGRAHNELTRYRYDVVLSTAPAEVRSVTAIPTMAWGSQLANLDQLSRFMATDAPAPLRVTGVPNRRLHSGPRAHAAPDPEQFHALAARHGMWAALTWSDEDAELLDVVLLPATTRPPLTGLLTRTGRDDDLTHRPLANSPAARTVPTPDPVLL